jgi:hypothetical protein
MDLVVVIGRLFRGPASYGALRARWVTPGVSFRSGLRPVSHQRATTLLLSYSSSYYYYCSSTNCLRKTVKGLTEQQLLLQHYNTLLL